MIFPELMKRNALQRAAPHNALCFRPIDQLPGLANLETSGKFFAELFLKASAAPDAFLEDRLEKKRFLCVWLRHLINGMSRPCADTLSFYWVTPEGKPLEPFVAGIDKRIKSALL